MSSVEQEWRLLRGLGDRAIELDSLLFGAVEVHRAREQAGLTREETDESLAVLVARGMVELERGSTGLIAAGRLTDAGFDYYLRSSRLGGPTPYSPIGRPSSQKKRPA